MKDTTIRQTLGEFWRTIKIRKEYYEELYRKYSTEMNLAFKLVYEELDDQIDWLINKFEEEE